MTYHSITPSGRDTSSPGSMRRRLALIDRHFPVRPGFRILDAGCGAGDYCEHFRQMHGVEVAGVEFEEAKVKLARQLGRAYVQRGNLERLDFVAEAFDWVLLNEVIEHVTDEAACLKELHRVLKPGGGLCVFAPNRLYPLETHAVHSLRTGEKICKFFPVIPWLPSSLAGRLVRFEARNYWPWRLRSQLRSAGFTILARDYLWQTFENISGESPRLVRRLSPWLRSASAVCGRIPFVKSMGVSQFCVAIKG